MQKTNKKPLTEKRIKAKVHVHSNLIYVVPDQNFTESDIYAITLKNEDWSTKYPQDVCKVDFEYCPYCGEKLLEVYEKTNEQ